MSEKEPRDAMAEPAGRSSLDEVTGRHRLAAGEPSTPRSLGRR